MIDRLRLRVRPIEGEPAHSLLARLAGRHDMPADRFAHALDLRIRSVAKGENIAQVAALAEVATDALAAATARRTGVGQSVMLGREVLSWVDWSISPRRVCQGCFADDRAQASGVPHSAWHRRWWDVEAIRVCPRHKRPLQDHCPVCNDTLDWSCLALDRCQNGHDLADPGTGDDGVALDSYLVGRLISAKSAQTNAFLDQLTMGNAARAAERVGAVCRHGWSEHFEPHQGEDLRSVGYSATQEIERSFLAALDKVLAEAPTGSVGLIASYGWIYRSWLGVPGADQSGGRLLDLLLQHAARRGIISDGERCDQADTMPLGSAAAVLGKSRETTRKVIAAAGMLPAGSRPGVPFPIDKSALEDMCRRLGRLVDLNTASGILGIGRRQLRSLISAGLLQYDPDASKIGYGHMLCSDRLAAFCHAITAEVPAVHQQPLGALALAKACRDASVPIWKACQAVLRGEVKPLAYSGAQTGLAGVWIFPSTLQQLAIPRAHPIASVAQTLGIHPQAASCLVKAGAFDCMKNPSPASVEAFAARYARPAELAGITGGSPRTVVKRLAAANVVPAFGPPKCRQIFYSRAEALERLRPVLPISEAT